MEKPAAAASGNTKMTNNGAGTSNSAIPQGVFNVADEATSYMECRRNYTAAIGDYVVDGCRKFVRFGGQFDETNVEAIVCANCGCHRRFHRKVDEVLLLPPPPAPVPHLRDRTCLDINMKEDDQQRQYCYMRPVTGQQEQQPPTTWMFRTVTPPTSVPNHEPVEEEGQGSCKSPTEFAEETYQSDDGEEEVNKPWSSEIDLNE